MFDLSGFGLPPDKMALFEQLMGTAEWEKGYELGP
jgi:hypothetical protein